MRKLTSSEGIVRPHKSGCWMVIRWVRPSECLNFWTWMSHSWVVTPVIGGYRRIGTGLRGWRRFGLEVDYV